MKDLTVWQFEIYSWYFTYHNFSAVLLLCPLSFWYGFFCKLGTQLYKVRHFVNDFFCHRKGDVRRNFSVFAHRCSSVKISPGLRFEQRTRLVAGRRASHQAATHDWMMPILSLGLISVIRCRIPVTTHLTCNCYLFYPCLNLQAAQHVWFPQGHERRLWWSKGQILPFLLFSVYLKDSTV